jgi:hypothetical protein
MERVADYFSVAGSVLVLAGLVWGGIGLRRLRQRPVAERAEIKRVVDTATANGEDTSAALRAVGLPFTTYGDGKYGKQDMRLAALEHLLPSFSGPYMTAALGALLSVVGGVLSVLSGS